MESGQHTNMLILFYLASPYTNPRREVVLERVHKVNLAAAHLFKKGYFVFAPICHTHSIRDCCNFLEGYWEFWQDYDKKMLSLCDELVILTLPGWTDSKGVIEEIAYAKVLKMPISYLDPDTFIIT